MVGLLVGGVAVAPATAGAADKAGAEKAIAAAVAAQKKAASAGGEWRDTGAMIKQAQEAVAAKEYDQAMTLADQARDQGEIGYQQAEAQKDQKISLKDFMY
jgi:hypothetical protein